MPDAALVALDWGSTTFRAWLLDGAGGVLDTVRSDDGALAVSADGVPAANRARAFESVFEQRCGPWLAAYPGLPVLCAGMAGSNHGWAEAGYVDVPATLDSLADRLTAVPAHGVTVHLVPGLRVAGADPDVMRGEEVQLAGVLALADDPPSTVVLPGTHSKWVRLDGARVTGFTTAMTGELYGLLLRDSILARLADGDPAPDVTSAFVRGLDTERDHGDDRGLPALLFTARTLVLAGRLDPTEVADYVSGLLVGAEVRHGLRAAGDVVALCGPESTAGRYRHALERHGARVRVVGPDAAVVGLWRVARDAGLVPDPADPQEAA
ncbi:2-dehydro-3-deoxygalactonokinase [Promicromonospora thailandica]|uniref:2-dehydro-3-deoxygalactonokinase n=1 Tax=Promicromonospora thailandica TaxID=765201 RepID=A0A9X2JVU5_9MICO|nr:2-dehydro-3-deoxygalactonokinase [Promicromonospora thailandica]MCP2264857.1 2-dehydro-3-deoxygalactonokinase [Promicromonospora thailandica]BFF18885.1 2-dehydro-3-deoxygalactonokinase [Promicromonospora thailandica]